MGLHSSTFALKTLRSVDRGWGQILIRTRASAVIPYSSKVSLNAAQLGKAS